MPLSIPAPEGARISVCAVDDDAEHIRDGLGRRDYTFYVPGGVDFGHVPSNSKDRLAMIGEKGDSVKWIDEKGLRLVPSFNARGLEEQDTRTC